jgi:hypothetical protein
MPKTITELMNGGLVTARHPGLLSPGELQIADDTVYRNNDLSIWRAPGRASYGTLVSGQPVYGLAALPFEGTRPSYLIGLAPYGTTAIGANGALTRGALHSLPLTFAGGQTSTEIGSPRAVTGDTTTVTSHTTFTATTGNPFLPSIVGSKVFTPLLNGTGKIVIVTAVSTTVRAAVSGRYASVVVKLHDETNSTATGIFTPTVGIVLAFEFGVVSNLPVDLDSVRKNTLEVAQFGGSYFSWFGVNVPRKIEWFTPTSPTADPRVPLLRTRPCGMLPVTDAISVAVLAGGWRRSLGTGYFWFLVTEIQTLQDVIPGAYKLKEAGEIEGTYEANQGAPVPVLIPADYLSGARITLPAVKNIGADGRYATHWGIYMSLTPTKDAFTQPLLSTFRRVRKHAITTQAAGATVDISETNYYQILNATSIESYGGQPDWTNQSAMVGAQSGLVGENNPASYARGRSASDAIGDGAVAPEAKARFTIDASGLWATRVVTGIRFRVGGRANSSGSNQVHAEIGIEPITATQTGFRKVLTTSSWENNTGPYKLFGADYQVEHGGPGESWGVSWGAFSGLAASFGLHIFVVAQSAKEEAWVDWIQMTIWGDSTDINVEGKSYRVVVYRDQIGTTIIEPAYRPPETCSTGDFFMGSLVLNDTLDENAIRWSLPGEPEYFPKSYMMRLNLAKKRDKITCLRTLGTVLIVGLENSIERVNYLPSETSTDLKDGLAHEELATDHGIPGPLAAVKFDMAGQGTILAYASAAGCFLTNGVWTRPMNIGLDWLNTVKLAALESCVFRVYPREKWLVLYYCPFGATHNRNTRKLVFSYSMSHIKEGGFLPVLGPTVVSGRASAEVIDSGTSKLVTGHETSGVIYIEDSGTTIPSGYRVLIDSSSDTPASFEEGDGKTAASVDVKILPRIRTRRMYPAGIERDAREERIYVLFSPYGANSVTALPAVGGAVVNTQTVGNTTISSNTAVFSSVLAGMRIMGTGIDPGTIVISVAGDFKSIVLSRAPNTTAAGGITLTFDTGTLAVTVYASGIGEAVATLDTSYASTLVGDLIVVHNDNVRQGLEIQFEKVVLPSGSSVDLGVNMRLHQFSVLLNDQGLEQNRSVA